MQPRDKLNAEDPVSDSARKRDKISGLRPMNFSSLCGNKRAKDVAFNSSTVQASDRLEGDKLIIFPKNNETDLGALVPSTSQLPSDSREILSWQKMGGRGKSAISPGRLRSPRSSPIGINRPTEAYQPLPAEFSECCQWGEGRKVDAKGRTGWGGPGSTSGACMRTQRCQGVEGESRGGAVDEEDVAARGRNHTRGVKVRGWEGSGGRADECLPVRSMRWRPPSESPGTGTWKTVVAGGARVGGQRCGVEPGEETSGGSQGSDHIPKNMPGSGMQGGRRNSPFKALQAHQNELETPREMTEMRQAARFIFSTSSNRRQSILILEDSNARHYEHCHGRKDLRIVGYPVATALTSEEGKSNPATIIPPAVTQGNYDVC
ncbi:hypothetical protein FB451DRAFT_1162644 [Mycena latifolia]|nr:hypothetical protein FB451DRAFT_1162644 [Mycena latifolia]